jgi:aldose sugar dehydrogenase
VVTSPTGMAFIDDTDILILEKDLQVRVILNGVLEDKPILKVPVDITSERGLLGIAIMSEGSSNNDTNAANISEPLSGKTKNRIFILYRIQGRRTIRK